MKYLIIICTVLFITTKAVAKEGVTVSMNEKVHVRSLGESSMGYEVKNRDFPI